MTTLAAAKTEHGSFTLERTFKASPAHVFKAWANNESYYKWLISGDGWDIRKFERDFRAGGREYSEFAPTGSPDSFSNTGVYLDIVPEARIVYAYTMDKNGKPFSASLATIEISADGKSTKLKFTEQGVHFDGVDSIEMRRKGWEGLMLTMEKEIMRIAAG
jgi:uncharacterized protein YndB with AHSA1/START domain